MRKIGSKKYLQTRWSDPNFVAQQDRILRRVFEDRDFEGPADLRGIPVGVRDQMPEFIAWVVTSCFFGARVANVDLSCSRFSCSFSNGDFRRANFSHCEFDTCPIFESHFEDSEFCQSRFRAPQWHKNTFTDCKFNSARLRGRILLGDGPDRTVFRNCDFSDVLFTKLEFRGAEFHDCCFEGTRFVSCFMLANDFYGNAPSKDQFEECEFRGRHHGLEWYDPSKPPMFRWKADE